MVRDAGMMVGQGATEAKKAPNGILAPSFTRGCISYNDMSSSHFKSNIAYINSFFDFCYIMLTFGKQAFAFQKGHFPLPALPYKRLEGYLLPSVPSLVSLSKVSKSLASNNLFTLGQNFISLYI